MNPYRLIEKALVAAFMVITGFAAGGWRGVLIVSGGGIGVILFLWLVFCLDRQAKGWDRKRNKRITP